MAIERQYPTQEASLDSDASWDSLGSQLNGIESESLFDVAAAPGVAVGSIGTVTVSPVYGSAVNGARQAERAFPVHELSLTGDVGWDSFEGQLEKIEGESIFGPPEIVAVLAEAVGEITLASAAIAQASAILSVTLDNVAAAGSALAPALSALSTALDDVTVLGFALAPVSAVLSEALGDTTLVSTVQTSIGLSASLSATLEDVSLSSAATSPALTPSEAALSVFLGDVLLHSESRSPVTATLSATLDDVVVRASESIEFYVSVTLGDVLLASAGRALALAVVASVLDDVECDAEWSRSYTLEQIGICDLPAPGWFYKVRARTGEPYSVR